MAEEQLAETVTRLNQIIEPALADEGFELVDLEFKGGSKSYAYHVCVTIDRLGRETYSALRNGEGVTGGVTVSDCVRMSKLLGPVLDVEDVIPGEYDFQVSSPGVNRPLTKPAHYQKALGMKVRVKTRVPVDGESFFIAPLLEADTASLTIKHRGTNLAIPLRLVKKANLEYEF
jgi:ribosome maturation factor RimP